MKRTIKNGSRLNLDDFTYTEIIVHCTAISAGTVIVNMDVELHGGKRKYSFDLIEFIDPEDDAPRYAVRYTYRDNNHGVEFIWDHSTREEADETAKQVVKNTTRITWPF